MRQGTIHRDPDSGRAASMRPWHVLCIGQEIPDRRQVAGHPGMHLRHDSVTWFVGQSLYALPRGQKIKRRAACQRRFRCLPAVREVRAFCLGENLLQGGEKAGVGWVEHRGWVSGCGAYTAIGLGS